MKDTSIRIKVLKDQLLENKREISLERANLYTDSFKQSEGKSSILRRALATAHILENVNIAIKPHELILGDRTIKPRSGIASPEMSPYWILDEIDTMYSRPQDKFYFTKEDKTIFKEKLYPFWDGKSLKDYVDSKMSEQVKQAINIGIVKINQTDKGQGHIIPTFEKIFSNGLAFLIDEIKDKLKTNVENDFLHAGLITLESLKKYMLRYAHLATTLALEESDYNRKQELIELHDICTKISHEKPQSLHEALQLFWFVNLALQYESNASSISTGRFDQFMLPFYRQSISDGIEEEYCRELLRCLWLKMNDVVLLRSEDSAKYFAGFPTGYTIILGGVDKAGRDATNELSYIILETYGDIRLPQPNIGVRIHEKSPMEFLMKVAETIRLGTGIPQVFNDEVIIPGYLNRGVSLEDARDYAVVGCVELSLPGKTYGLHDIALFNLLKVMEVTLDKHKENITSFDMLINEIKNTIKEYVKYMVDGSNITDAAHGLIAPTPLLSCFIDDCVAKGSDVSTGGAIYNFSGVQGIGISNLSDSLYVIKKAVFEDKDISLSELHHILHNNYHNNEIARQRFINKYDKYGNDIDEVDYIGSDILSYYCREVEKYTNIRGGIFQPGSYTVSAHIPLGEAVGATADGRLSKEQLADGGLSPMVGRDKNGPTSVLKSVSKLDNYLTTNGSLLNVKFSPSVLDGVEGLRKFVNYLQGFMRLKIQHIQFNIVSAKTLKDAQKNPLKYKDLVIRVAGYSAIFVELNKAIQDDIINRTEHGM
ncbi:formate C-acetyltransferase [Alkalibaculum sp. M08DMB]|uniref:Formate C-acetyltransferase n=1 Tax=Alkalibaculum sporogenes TaxID=2655001 RepID=A0A6A7K8M7_9FIRM|nr:formate C-acetyltransferase [Alkalibaculum sporogenes]MPW25671.1 formate C-acetyltransferase [Alkalibaculum sporogenes]